MTHETICMCLKAPSQQQWPPGNSGIPSKTRVFKPRASILGVWKKPTQIPWRISHGWCGEIYINYTSSHLTLGKVRVFQIAQPYHLAKLHSSSSRRHWLRVEAREVVVVARPHRQHQGAWAWALVALAVPLLEAFLTWSTANEIREGRMFAVKNWYFWLVERTKYLG